MTIGAVVLQTGARHVLSWSSASGLIAACTALGHAPSQASHSLSCGTGMCWGTSSSGTVARVLVPFPNPLLISFGGSAQCYRVWYLQPAAKPDQIKMTLYRFKKREKTKSVPKNAGPGGILGKYKSWIRSWLCGQHNTCAASETASTAWLWSLRRCDVARAPQLVLLHSS